jgi:hypothetical protein
LATATGIAIIVTAIAFDIFAARGISRKGLVWQRAGF